MNKLILVLIASIAIVFGGFFFLNNYIYEEKQAEPTYEPYRATLTGEYLCLPHKDTSGPHTMECAFGLKLEDGSYYAIDFALMSQTVPELQTGEHITANGFVTPIERLSTDHWQTYPIAGIFSVTDSLKREDVEENFEGEADPSRMKLGMKKWNWVSAQYEDGRQVFPRDPSAFTLSFDENAKTVSIGTDCNSGGGSYTVKGETLAFGPIASTLMFCAESQETEFFQFLENTSGFHFTSRGELVLHLKSDSGTVTFR